MPAGKSILLCGATGLVGAECLRQLLAEPHFSRIVVLSRRPLPAHVGQYPGADKLDQHVVDFEQLEAHSGLLKVDQIVCALGTTIKKAGSQAAFRRVDYDYPLPLAKLGLRGGARHFLLVSAIGADPGSRFFYNRVKGELETELAALPYRSLTIARPSLLLGPRSEFRLGEEAAKRLAFLFPSRYRPVAGAAVAAALVQAAQADREGRRVIANAELLATES